MRSDGSMAFLVVTSKENMRKWEYIVGSTCGFYSMVGSEGQLLDMFEFRSSVPMSYCLYELC